MTQPLSACASNILDTLSDVLDKCLRFSLIKIESVLIFQAKPAKISKPIKPSKHVFRITS